MPSGCASHSLARARLRAKLRKCHTRIESSDTIWRRVSRLPLQISVRRTHRDTVRRTSRPRLSHRG